MPGGLVRLMAGVIVPSLLSSLVACGGPDGGSAGAKALAGRWQHACGADLLTDESHLGGVLVFAADGKRFTFNGAGGPYTLQDGTHIAFKGGSSTRVTDFVLEEDALTLTDDGRAMVLTRSFDLSLGAAVRLPFEALRLLLRQGRAASATFVTKRCLIGTYDLGVWSMEAEVAEMREMTEFLRNAGVPVSGAERAP